jgi:hypothetical protein
MSATTSANVPTDDSGAFLRRLLAATLFAAGAALAAACLAIISVHWSVKPVLSPWSAWVWPYVLYASAAAIWLYLITVPHFVFARHGGVRRALLTACSASAGAVPMLVLAGWMTRPIDPWLPVICIWTVAAALATIVAWSSRLSVTADLLIRLGLVVWLFILPALALLNVGISTQAMPMWGRVSPLYWLATLMAL